MAEAKLTPSKRGTSRGRVLVAEDDAECRRLVSTVLSHDGYDVLEVVDGSTMFEYLAACGRGTEFPDVIVADICMPGRSGLDVLSHLRELGIAAPVVLMTAFPDHCTEANAVQLGAVTLVEKPFEIDDLRMIVLNLSSSRKGKRESVSPVGGTP
jgi:DNA-binding NtrC family response regulator